jgi:PAS domain S-box-containing protein
MPTPDPYAALQNLRARAERRRLAAVVLPSEVSPEVARLVQELQVHQIELEMQYEELLVAQNDAEHSRAQYVDLYDFAPVGYCTLDTGGTLLQLNLQTGLLLGLPRQQLLRRRLAVFVDPADRGQFAEFMARLWRAPGQRITCELAMRRHDDTPFFAQLEGLVQAEPDAEPGALPRTCRLVLLDVSVRRQAAAELAGSEARFRATFEQSREGMLLLDDHHFVNVNDAAVWMLRRTDRREVVGHHLAEFWPEFQPDGRRSMDVLTTCMARAQADGWCRLEWTRTDSAGLPVWDEITFNPVLVQGKALLHGVWRDITDRKRLHQAKLDQQQQLAQAVLAAEESEKRRIAESLHNGLGQILYAAKLSLNQLSATNYQQHSPAGTQAYNKATALLAEAIAQARTLAHELIPRTLEDFGLEAAIQDICTDFSIAPLRMSCHIEGLPAALPPHLTLATYRMAQELANNVVKHAHATQAILHLTTKDQYLVLRAEDNGIGFAIDAAAKPKGMGWQVLQDRVRLLNGTLNLESHNGTNVTIRLPLPS